MNSTDKAYLDASAKMVMSVESLRAMAPMVFGSMLRFALAVEGQTVWTAVRIQNGKLDLEVGTFPPFRPKPKGKIKR